MNNKLFAVVPAAGIGARMQADRPKQYLSLGGQTILEHTLERLLAFSFIECIALPIANHDAFFDGFYISHHEKIHTCAGGSERFESVLNGLNYLLENGAKVTDWVMVHDAARPCITQADLIHLYQSRSEQGSILGVQVRDTMKRTDEQGNVISTVEREQLWHALTPQLAPIGVLKTCIDECVAKGKLVTDEASALEFCGLQPKMVAGHPSNIKVTRPDDLMMAQAFIKEFQ
ncbi:2-C-methyl-D-erythritol 4-phosphate cytidylyltransferase [Oceaniserpentilla sp. 4NH20-0058]|uniref:2-C-methyl-D-erythritol 4-phosphate cytidylyltransferase n=1 Tax=Oceaniserpentilla sp. 4NH20-0058 TaxID=3127660 RepID=UPI00310386F7